MFRIGCRQLVTVESDPKDERRKRVALTDAGRKRLPEMDALIEAEQRNFRIPSGRLADPTAAVGRRLSSIIYPTSICAYGL